jgi:hypothetical protein
VASSTIEAKRVLIWENPNHTAGISAATTINVDTTQYNEFEVISTFVNALDSLTQTFKCPQGYKLNTALVSLDTTTTGYAAINYVCRQIDVGVDPNKIVIGAGYMFYQGALYAGWDARCVPQYIYGIK